MITRSIARVACAAAVAAGIPLAAPAQHASAAGCPDIEVVFARGTAEPPGLGITGGSFYTALVAQAGGRSVSSYGVNYEASADFAHPTQIAHSVMAGIRDTQAHLQYIVATCPGTRIVLGGYSQGATVAGYATTDHVPTGISPAEVGVLPPNIASHVAAVVLFARPSDRWLHDIGAPPLTIGPGYAGRTMSYCIAFDTICDGSPVGQPNGLHVLYAFNGMTVAGASYALSRV